MQAHLNCHHSAADRLDKIDSQAVLAYGIIDAPRPLPEPVGSQ
jgi:hypothetical protein